MTVIRYLAVLASAVLVAASVPAVAHAAGAPPAASAVLAPASALSSVTTVPRPDHVVILILENHSSGQILGNPDAPYINSLAASGANMTSSFALTHPSQPNYIGLFSGSLNGVIDNSCPFALSADNLGAQLITSGQGFAGYAEDLPSVGYTGCTSGDYARKHSPWVNFTNVPASANLPLTQFPTDYSTLPAVSIVIPNLQHDMHDGSIAQGDAWIQAQMDGYVQWAQQHNSVFLLTFDEDDNTSNNQIATVFHGQNVRPGQYSDRIDHYSVLRTLQDAYGLAPIGNSATASPILDIWKPDVSAPQASFTTTCLGLTCSVDGSGSTAVSGSLTGWRWRWGDGSETTDPTRADHTYAAAGDFTVTLQVTDDQGRTAQTTRTVSPRAAGPVAVAADAFRRTVAAGWGTADIGGSWTVNSTAKFSVASGVGRVNATAGSTLNADLTQVTAAATDTLLSVGVDKVPNQPANLTIAGRRVVGSLYGARVRINANGTVQLNIMRDATALAGGTLPGVVMSPGVKLRVRLQVDGVSPTVIRTRAWPASGPEPTTWQYSASDSAAALQQAGSLRLSTYLSSSATNGPVVVSYEDLSVTALGGPPPPANTPPVAAFTWAANGLTVTADSATSSDSDGTIVQRTWSLGGVSASGVTATRTFPASGTYPVTLTVTDDDGATATSTQNVAVTAPVSNVLAADAFERVLGSGWGAADTGGTWTVNSTAKMTVAGGAGRVSATAGSTLTAGLDAVASTAADAQMTVALDRMPNQYLNVSMSPRAVGASAYGARLRVNANGSAVLQTMRDATALTGTTVPGLTIAAGTKVHMRVQVSGTSPTTIRARVWLDGSAEPSTWLYTATDATPGLQQAGGLRVSTYLSSSTTNGPVIVSYDDVAMTAVP